MPKKTRKKCDNKSAGVLICDKSGRIYLIERMKNPYGYAPPAGHVDKDGNDFREAARRETDEEVGLKVHKLTLLLKRTFENQCRRIGGSWHRWHIFKASAWSGRPRRSKQETKSASWFTRVEIAELAERTEMYLKGKISEKEWEKNPGLEVVWYKIFKILKMI